MATDKVSEAGVSEVTRSSRKWLNWVNQIIDGELIGYVQATVYCDDRSLIAYVLNSRYWGRGFASEAVQAMLTELIKECRVTRIYAVVSKGNCRSKNLLKRLHFSQEQNPPSDIDFDRMEEIVMVMEGQKSDLWTVRSGKFVEC